MRHYVTGVVLAAILFLTGCQESYQPKMPLRADLSGYERPFTTASPLALKYLQQGLVLYYGFHHEAAIASFDEAGMLDSTCAMVWWGRSISAGPHINNPFMDSATAYGAWEDLKHAQRLAAGASEVERDLIGALAARYAWPLPEDRRSLDIAYADAMREVRTKHRDDMDVAALFVDALMNLRPWDLWTPQGEPRPETPEIISVLEEILRKEPNHPAACHFMIHTMEASPFPDRALAAADSLRNRIPGVAHLVHMPSHIDIRLGRYEAAIRANEMAVAVDSTWPIQPGFYAVYRAHNYHFLAYAAMFDGQKEKAMKAARGLVKSMPLETVRMFPDFLDGFLSVPYHVMVRFGMWNELLKEPEPPPDLYATVAFWRYGRTVALSALGRVREAEKELATLKAAYREVPESRYLGNNPVRTVLEIGLPMAEGEFEYRRKNYGKAFRFLRTAVQRDDSLKYDEPWGWMMPVRHALGALLLEQGRVKEAEAVYSQDLVLHPANGWALKGLAECYQRADRMDEAQTVEEKLQVAWARSDIDLQSSCFCRTKWE